MIRPANNQFDSANASNVSIDDRRLAVRLLLRLGGIDGALQRVLRAMRDEGYHVVVLCADREGVRSSREVAAHVTGPKPLEKLGRRLDHHPDVERVEVRSLSFLGRAAS